MKIFDTRLRTKVEFKSLEPGVVKMYNCGPTVYQDAHIGNFRAYTFADLLRRTFKYLGYKIIQVMNITDVDDKTIRQARQIGIPLKEHTAPIIDQFFRDLDALKIERADFYPHATEHIPEMIELVQVLIDKGYAYEMDGSYYFSIAKYPDYGKLSGMKLEALSRGVRIDADEYEKDDFRDFAVWKGWTEEDGDVYWDAPFGRGRPGWHIECSAMSRKYLGDEFDLHTGGVDNMFPHHENEIAQSVAATGKSFARHWMHNAHLVLEDEKMSKSLGNTLTVSDLIKSGYPMRAVRYVLLSAQYRQPLNFSKTAVNAAVSSLERLDTIYQVLHGADGSGDIRSEVKDAVDAAQCAFREGLEDDLNVSQSLSALFNFVSNIHRITQNRKICVEEGELVSQFWRGADSVLGVLTPVKTELKAEIEALVKDRLRLRQEKKFAEADEIRKKLFKEGYSLEDSKGETLVVWHEGREIIKYL